MTGRLHHIHTRVREEIHLRLFSDAADVAVAAQLHHAVRDGEMLHRAHHGDDVALFLMILVDIPEVRVDEDVAIRQKKRLRNFSLQQAQAAPGAQRRVLVHIIHGVILLQIVEIALDHALFVVYDHRKRAAAHIRKAVDDMLHNGHFPNGDQGLGQYFGVGIQTRAQTARHDDHGRACFFM